jgi:hypothetical protein
VIIVEVGENPFKIEGFVFRSYFLRAQRHKDGKNTRKIPAEIPPGSSTLSYLTSTAPSPRPPHPSLSRRGWGGRGNKVSPLIQGGLRGVKGLPDTTVKQCDKVEVVSLFF